MLEAMGRHRDGPDAGQRIFTSAREIRLWAWAAVVVAATYASVAFGGTLQSILSDRDAVDSGFVLAFILVVITILFQALKVRASSTEIGVVLGVTAACLLLVVRTGVTERTHLIEYGIVAMLVYEALDERRLQGRRVPAAALMAIAITIGIGVADECLQWLLPGRVFDPVDIGFDAVAAVLAVVAMAALRRARARSDVPSR